MEYIFKDKNSSIAGQLRVILVIIIIGATIIAMTGYFFVGFLGLGISGIIITAVVSLFVTAKYAKIMAPTECAISEERFIMRKKIR